MASNKVSTKKVNLFEEGFGLFKECIHNRNTRVGVGWHGMSLGLGITVMSLILLLSGYVEPPVKETTEMEQSI